jgi:hypothetical protein
VEYGRVTHEQRPLRDESLRTTGVALIIVGLFETLFGFVLAASCTGIFNGSCVVYGNASAGIVLGVAGAVVLIAGALVYAVGRHMGGQERA